MYEIYFLLIMTTNTVKCYENIIKNNFPLIICFPLEIPHNIVIIYHIIRKLISDN